MTQKTAQASHTTPQSPILQKQMTTTRKFSWHSVGSHKAMTQFLITSGWCQLLLWVTWS